LRLRKLAVLTIAVSFSLTIGSTLAQANHSGIPPQHFQGWLCIHSREGGWYDDTGNGYYGGLQMSYDWMGVINGKASDYSPIAQMVLAEMVSARYHFSYEFMAQQWPNTFPSCAEYFK
jgi:hypothetical protein